MDTVLNTPVIKNVDFAIISGSISAVSAALYLSEQKYRVILIVKETYLISDLCSSDYYYLRNKKNEEQKYFKMIFDKSVDANDVHCKDCRVLHPDRLKLNTEEICDINGIEYIYAAVPIDVLKYDHGQKILRIAGKFGICGISCRDVLHFNKLKNSDRYMINIMGSPDISQKVVINVKTSKNSDFDVYVRPGAYGKGHATLDIPICSRASDMDYSKKEYSSKLEALNVLKWIKENIHGFSKIRPGRSGSEGFSSQLDIEEEIERGIRRAKDALDGYESEGSIKPQLSMPQGLRMVSDNPTADYREYDIFKSRIPCINSIIKPDLVVVGGGTSGTMAALYGARHGVRTVLVESNDRCGGTATAGGVSAYWFGKCFKENKEIDKKVDEIYRAIDVERNRGIWRDYDEFNPDIKSTALLKMCIDAGVVILFNTVSFASIVDADRKNIIKGVAASNGEEISIVLGRYVIDATGDGDIAVFAGADFTYGNGRDMFTYWASLAQYTSPEKYKNNFSSTVVVSDINDYTRFIRAGRRRGDNTYDHGTYLAPRESRHIKGLYEVNLKDIVSFRNYDDSVYTCFSNYDPKGKVTADMVYGGVLPPPISSAIPLRSLLPVDTDGNYMEGVLVAGKAISCTHNAFPGIRMQTDLQHQGAVLGLIAAYAIGKNADVLDLDIRSLQKEIYDATDDDLAVAEQKSLTEDDIVSQINENERLDWVDLPFTDEIKQMPVTIRAAVADSGSILPELENEFAHEQNTLRKSLLARFILWHGCDVATDFILNEIRNEFFEQGGLPERKGSIMCVQLLPDHGVMPEIVYKLNLLAWSSRSEIYKPFEEVLKRLSCTERDYSDIKKGIYHYIESFTYVAERTCVREFIPMLNAILEFPEIQNAVSSKKMSMDIMQERLVMLGLSILRALARCGDIEGYYGLAGLMNNSCASVAISACMELQKLTGNKTGVNPRKWNKIISSMEADILPCPIDTKTW